MCGFLISTEESFTHRTGGGTLRRRGPDAVGFYADSWLKIVHHRLAILGLDERGTEPLESRHHVLAFNGEIYNWQDLRRKYAGTDDEFPTDAHVLLHLWELLGAECLKELHGFWAFGVYDKRDGTLILCRDQLGIKPLYYTTDGPFKAASTIAALAHKGPLDFAALSEYARYQFTFGDKTFFRHVRKVLPGQVVTFRPGRHDVGTAGACSHPVVSYAHADVEKRTYEDVWRPSGPLVEPTQAWIDETRDIMRECILESCTSDAGFTTFCSGGLDSGIVTCVARPVHAWHANYSDPQCNETEHARAVAGCSLSRLLVHNADDHPDLVERLRSIVEDFDELSIGAVILPLDELLGRVRMRGDKVVLSGTGGDELFAGYARHALALGHPTDEAYAGMFERVRNLPWAFAFEHAHAKGADVYKFMDVEAARVAFFRAFDEAGGAIGFDRRHFLAGLLNLEDRIAGRHGVEARPSLLHQRFVRRVREVEASPVPELKRLGKRLARGLVPDSVIDRRDKLGFATPIGTFAAENASRLREFVSSSRHRDMFDLGKVRWVPERGAGKWDRSQFGLGLLVAWMERYA